MPNTSMTSQSQTVFTMPDRIETPRAVLRKVRAGDAPAMSEHVSDYDISKMTGSLPYPMPLITAEIWMILNRAAWDRATRFNYALCLKSKDGQENALRGIIGFFKMRNGSWELGYWVARPLWGQGYAVECAQAALTAFEAANGRRAIHAGVFDGNPASVRVLSKLGFTPTGEKDNPFSMARLARAPGRRFIREPGHDG